MQTWDTYKLVCDPFKYVEFARMGNVAKHLAFGLLICLFLHLDYLARFFIALWVSSANVSFHHYTTLKSGVLFGLNVFGFTERLLARLIFAVVVCRLALLVRRSLKDSSRLQGEQQGRGKKALYRRLFYFCLIPQFLNFAFLVSEIAISIHTTTGMNIQAFSKNNCHVTDVLQWTYIWKNIKACTFAFGSLTYYLAFVVLFPSVRDTFMCKS